MQPSGGPRDETPPAIAESDPEPGATSVRPEAVRLVFSEYVAPESLPQALSVAPAFDQPLEYDWDGRAVEIEFPEPLRENTTYLLTLGTELRDTRGVALQEPITFAFSTGPTINRGRIEGRVVEAGTGGGLGGLDVYAYAAPDSTAPNSLPERPAYRTQTGPDGAFAFDYLAEEPFYVVALRDQNRNRQPDPLEAFAVPPRPVIRADSSAPAVAEPWIAAVRDTLAPELLRVQPLSENRLTARFDEPVRLARRQAGAWAVDDSLADEARAVRAVYQRAGAPQQVFLETDALAPTLHRLRVAAGAVVDTTGTPLPATTARFTPPAAADTARARFAGFVPPARRADSLGTLLLPGAAPGVALSQPVDSARLAGLVSAQDTAGRARSFSLETSDGTTYRLALDPPLAPGEAVRIGFDARRPQAPSDTLYRQLFRRISARELGEISGFVTGADTAGAVVVELYPTGGALRVERRTAQAGPDGRFLFGDLPEGAFRFRAFVDRDGDGRWSPGHIAPYRPAEPLLWTAEPTESRPRWETVLPDTLRF